MYIRLSIYCYDDAGSYCEVYGDLRLNIGTRFVNEGLTMWSRTSSNYIEPQEYMEHHIDMTRNFYEYDAFTTSYDKIDLFGAFYESDSFDTDTVGIITGKSNAYVYAKDAFNVYKTQQFQSDYEDYVKVRVKFEYI